MAVLDNQQLWENALGHIELNVSKANFSTWFKNTHVNRHEDGVVELCVPNEFVKEWLYNKYHRVILRALRDASENVRSVEYVVCKEDHKTESKEKKSTAGTVNMSEGGTPELPLEELYIDKADNLNPRYTFDSFIIGSFNELAHAASQAVIKKPGLVYNPLFIYGGTGLGKTHLIQAVGNYLKHTGGGNGKRIHYITSEKFSVDYINSLQSNKINQFKEKYRKYDILIMDDIQFLSHKEKTQEELFHLFNALYDSNKQIVFSSDKHPGYIPALEDRLKSRFSAGMIVDISQPDFESRLAILKAKLAANNISLSEEVVSYLATLVEGSVRELEGILNLIVCQAQLKEHELTLNEVKSLVKNNTKPQKSVSIGEVVRTVADFYSIEEDTIYQKTRRKEAVKPRQVVMYLLREDFNVSFPSIGQKLGGRDHTTVIHSCERVKSDLQTNTTLSQELEQIRSMF